MKSSEQLRGWAVDRAIELRKANGPEAAARSVMDIIEDAQALCGYCFDAQTLAELDAEDAKRETEIKAEQDATDHELKIVGGVQ